MLNLNQNQTKSCQGSIFKAESNVFRTKRGFGLSVRLNRSKKYSCPGCEYCAWESDAFNEVNNDWPVLNIESCVSNTYYKIITCNEHRNWESGQIDIWDIKLIPFIPSEDNTNT